MAVPVAAILKKVAVAVGSNKNVLKTVCGIVLGIVVIVCMPIIALLGIFSGDTEIVIDTGPIYDWVEEGQPEFESTFQEVEEKMGEFFSFATYESAFNFAAEREYTFVRTGEWNSETWDTGIAMDAKDSVNAVNGKYFIYKKSGNPEEEVAYFTEERLYEVISEYAAVGIESFYYWEKEPAAISDGENLYSYSDGKKVLANSVQLGENIVCYLNGEPFEGTLVEREGESVLTVADEWGNTCEYSLIIIRTAPRILYATGEGSANTVTFDRTYYFKDAVTVSIADAYDEMAMFNVYDEAGTLIGSFSLGETYAITGSGSYTVEAVNHNGKSQVFSLIISRNAPIVEVTENGKNKTLDIAITESSDKESHIQTLEIYKSTNGGDTWELLTADDYGTAISANVDFSINVNDKGLSNSVTITANEEVTLVLTRNGEVVEYKFGDAITEPASYTLSVTDGLGNKAEMSFTVVEPLVQKFEHNFDEVSGFEKALVNGEEKRLNYGTLELFGDGTYEVGIVVSGKTYTFTVTVDATAPTLKLEGVENGGAATGGVVLSEPSETAEITVQRGEDKIEYKLGETISEEGEYGVTITDECGNSTVYTFTIEVGTNWTLIVLLVVFGLLVAGGVVFFFIRRNKASDPDEA